jgi:spore coat protein U-like protein
MTNKRASYSGLIVALFGVFVPVAAFGASTTGSLDVQMTIVADCHVTAGTVLKFGSQGALVADVDDQADLSITCTPGTNYSVGLDAGANPGTPGDIDTRRMKNGTSNFAEYQLYSVGDRSTAWGDTDGVNTLSATGTGAAQAFTVYGRVPAQTTPPAGIYQDTVTVTMTF